MSSIIVRKASAFDQSGIHQLLLNEFRITEPLAATFGATEAEVYDRYLLHVEKGLSGGEDCCSVVAIENNAIIGVRLAHKVMIASGEKLIRTSPGFTEVAELTELVLHQMDQILSNRLHEIHGAGLIAVLKSRAVCVSAKFGRKKIAQTMINKSGDLGTSIGCVYQAAKCTALGSQKLMAKMGFECWESVAYNSFTQYDVMCDGSADIKLMVACLKHRK